MRTWLFSEYELFDEDKAQAAYALGNADRAAPQPQEQPGSENIFEWWEAQLLLDVMRRTWRSPEEADWYTPYSEAR